MPGKRPQLLDSPPLIRDVRGPLSNAERIAIGCRTHGAPNTEVTSRASYIFNDYRLTQRYSHSLGQAACNHVGCAARSERTTTVMGHEGYTCAQAI
jgi:hypothetical protein